MHRNLYDGRSDLKIWLSIVHGYTFEVLLDFLKIFIFSWFGEWLKLKNQVFPTSFFEQNTMVFSLQPLTKPWKNENFQKIWKYLKSLPMDYTQLNFQVATTFLRVVMHGSIRRPPPSGIDFNNHVHIGALTADLKLITLIYLKAIMFLKSEKSATSQVPEFTI